MPRAPFSPAARGRICRQVYATGQWQGTRAGVQMRIFRREDPERPIGALVCIRRRWIEDRCPDVFHAVEFLESELARKAQGRRAHA